MTPEQAAIAGLIGDAGTIGVLVWVVTMLKGIAKQEREERVATTKDMVDVVKAVPPRLDAIDKSTDDINKRLERLERHAPYRGGGA